MPMSYGSSRSTRQDYQRPMKDEMSIKARNEKVDLEVKEKYGWNIFYKNMRKYTNKKNRRGKDRVPTEQEVEDEAERYLAVRKFYLEKNDRLISIWNLTYEEIVIQRAAICKECNAL